jgi:2-dehydro-3-deoxygluconokinase
MLIKKNTQTMLKQCDCLALGEVMLRFDPGNHRISKANRFNVFEGGGEYNVVQGLSRCFGLSTSMFTVLVDNEVGQLIESMIASSGVDTSNIQWKDFDKIGKDARNGIYFMERGFGVRGAKAVMDRGHTAISQLKATDVDWDILFEDVAPRWFHVGGVMAGLSEHSPQVVESAMIAAKKAGVPVSYDMNYRHSLWANKGGRAAAKKVDEQMIAHADVLFGIDNLSDQINCLDIAAFSKSLIEMQERYPNLESIVTTMRVVKDASHNLWGGICLHQNKLIKASNNYDLQIFDRVGGGDAFASGFIYGILQGLTAQESIDIAVAHGALVMTTPGDNSISSLEEVLALAKGGDASALR